MYQRGLLEHGSILGRLRSDDELITRARSILRWKLASRSSRRHR